MPSFVYRINGPEMYGGAERGWGVSAILEKSFAERVAREKRTPRIEEILYRDASEIINEQARLLRKIGIDEEKKPFLFYEDTCLVQVIQVPGDACDIAMDESSIQYIQKFRESGKLISDLEYVPHNVDTFLQAIFLETLFRQWANSFEYII